MISQKKEYLDKYLPRKNNNAQSKPLPQLKIIDPDMDFEKNSSQGEDEVPQLVNTQGLVLSDFQAKTLLKKGMLEADLIGSNQQRKPEEPLSKALKVLYFLVIIIIMNDFIEYLRNLGVN